MTSRKQRHSPMIIIGVMALVLAGIGALATTQPAHAAKACGDVIMKSAFKADDGSRLKGAKLIARKVIGNPGKACIIQRFDGEVKFAMSFAHYKLKKNGTCGKQEGAAGHGGGRPRGPAPP